MVLSSRHTISPHLCRKIEFVALDDNLYRSLVVWKHWHMAFRNERWARMCMMKHLYRFHGIESNDEWLKDSPIPLRQTQYQIEQDISTYGIEHCCFQQSPRANIHGGQLEETKGQPTPPKKPRKNPIIVSSEPVTMSLLEDKQLQKVSDRVPSKKAPRVSSK